MQAGRGFFLLLLLTANIRVLNAAPQQKVEFWLTTPDRSSLLTEQNSTPAFKDSITSPLAIVDVDETHLLQPIDGFGFALTGGSAQLLMQMTPSRRSALLEELFGIGPSSIRVSYLRISVGASDMNDHVYTYDDMPAGQIDLALKFFTLAPDRNDVIPILNQILAINPQLKILATPWTAPSWMKTSDKPKAGHLKPEFYDIYAQYLIKYLSGMKAAGITISKLTIQNEPLNEKNTPSMEMLAEEEAAFLKNSLGPQLQRSHLGTKIILYDHNCDVPEYPLSILADKQAAQYTDGSGFHLYGGQITAMTKVHSLHPEKSLYFTEQMVIDRPGDAKLRIADPVARIVVGAIENWSRNVLLWNLAADPQNGPHTSDGGCPVCEGAITLEQDVVTRNLAYYTIAQISKFVPAGSVHLQSNSSAPSSLAQVAFRTPQGKYVLLVANTDANSQSFDVRSHGKIFSCLLPGGAVATYVW